MKKSSSGIKGRGFDWMDCILIVGIMLVAVWLYSSINKVDELQKERITLLQESKEKSEKILELAAALQKKLESNCDTMTVAEKLQQIKLDDYSLKVWNDANEARNQAFADKDKADMEAFKEKQTESMKAFNVYQGKKFVQLTEWSKKDQKNFATYVVMDFWESNSVYSDPELSNSAWQQREKIKKQPAIKSFISWDSAEYAKYQEADKIIQKKYEDILKVNDTKYQNKRTAADADYKKLVEQKKFELGL